MCSAWARLARRALHARLGEASAQRLSRRSPRRLPSEPGAADPATRDPHGIGPPKLPIETVLGGLCRAIDEAREALGVDAALILSFLQDRSTEEAMAM